jgi:hypothetical protein
MELDLRPNARRRQVQESDNLIDNSNVGRVRLLRDGSRRKAFRAFTSVMLVSLGGLLLLSLMCAAILDLGFFPVLKGSESFIHRLVEGSLVSSLGVLCLTLGFERKIDFDNIDSTLEDLNALIKHDNEQRDKRADELRNQYNSISTSLHFIDDKFLGQDNSFDVFWGISLLRAKARRDLLDPETFLVRKPDVPRFWLQMISNTDSTWFCTDRVELVAGESANHFWTRRLSKRGLDTQGSLAMDFGVSIRRVFVFDKKKDAEIPFVCEMMEKQASLEIKVGWVSLECALKYAPLKGFLDKLGTVDFTIINKKYLFSYKMLNNVVDSIECTSNQQLVSVVSEQYDLLFAESNRLS